MIFVPSKSMKISVLPEQEKQLSSKPSIEAACAQQNIIAFDICDDNVLIGFAMLRKYDEGAYFLWDYAIDRSYQNRKYGTRALQELIVFMQRQYNMTEMSTTYIWGNDFAKRLYEKAGFVETDVVDEEDCHEVNMIYMCNAE